MRVLNGPLEIAIRVATLLAEVYPRSLDLSQVVLADHAMLHSKDMGGPPSLLPPTPLRQGELSVKRTQIEVAIQILLGAELAQVLTTSRGLEYRATDRAYPFIALLESSHAVQVRDRATWVAAHVISDTADARSLTMSVINSWQHEFETLDD